MTNITHSIFVDIQKHAKRQVVYMKQGDAMSRELTISFYNDGAAWALPNDVTILQLAYCKEDFVGGCYDHMPDNTVAYSINTGRASATMKIHPQVLTVAGNVICELRLLNSSAHVLNTFNFVINVEKSPIAMTAISEGYYNNVFDGATFTPHISSDGVLSWTNDKGLPNPASVNLYNVLKTGDLADLDTTAKNTLVAALNEVHSKIGDLSDLDTTGKANLVAAINEVLHAIGNVEGDINTIKGLTVQEDDISHDVELSYQYGYYTHVIGAAAAFVSESGRACAVVPVSAGDKHLLSTRLGSTDIAGIIYTDADGSTLAFDLPGDGRGVTDIADYETIAPTGAVTLIVGSADSRTAYLPKLKKCSKLASAKAYSKAESDARYKPVTASDGVKRYGVKYDANDPSDTGSRCFDAVDMTATIGIGTTAGSSDFNAVYPWSEIKRCNISTNAAGAKIVTFEGDSAFKLDGSNGDVFVRIPKFCFERYVTDGYEYIVISESGRAVHPVFIENGKVLDEIFVSAFEGVILDNKLRSFGGVIPSSNQRGSAFLSAAIANGNGYTLYDMRCVSAIWMLMAVEFGCRNSNRIFGYGAADYLQPVARYSSLSSATAANSITIAKPSTTILNNLPVNSNITICSGTQYNVIAQRKLLSITNTDETTTLTFDGDPIDITTECFVGSAALSTNWCEDAPSGALSWHTGRAGWITGTSALLQNPMRYRWVENVFGNLWHFMPDVRFNNGQMYQARNIADYDLGSTIPEKYDAVGAVYPEQENNSAYDDVANASYWVSKLSDNHFAAGILFGEGYNMAQTSANGFGAHYYLLTDGVRNIANGGGFDHRYCDNILTHRAWIRSNTIWYLYGARLLYKDISNDPTASIEAALQTIRGVSA